MSKPVVVRQPAVVVDKDKDKEKKEEKEHKKDEKEHKKEVKESKKEHKREPKKKKDEEEKKEEKKAEDKEEPRVGEDPLPKDGEIIVSSTFKYEVKQTLGKGGFGAVYKVQRCSDRAILAMKCETNDVKKKVLSMDYKVLESVKHKSCHFCVSEDKGKTKGRFTYVIMTMVGKNLWDLRLASPNRRFSMPTSLKMAEQSLEAIKDLHSIGYIHRDVKPPNFAVGSQEHNQHHILFILDFGLCRKYWKKDTNKDLRCPRQVAPYRGTTRYASKTALINCEQSRKDDIESWLYMIVEWTAGGLPWKHLKGEEKEEVLKYKEEIRADVNAHNWLDHCPKTEYVKIMKYVDELQYKSIPDYDYVHYVLRHAMKSNNITGTEPLEWDPGAPYKGPPYVNDVKDKDKDGDPAKSVSQSPIFVDGNVVEKTEGGKVSHEEPPEEL